MKIKQRFKNFKANDHISWCKFYFGSVSKDVTKDGQSEVSLNGAVYDFSDDHS